MTFVNTLTLTIQSILAIYRLNLNQTHMSLWALCLSFSRLGKYLKAFLTMLQVVGGESKTILNNIV